MMKSVKVVSLVAILLMAGVSTADIRFHGSGSWNMLEGEGQVEGWQSTTAPDATSNVRANWGGNTVTLDYETTVNRFQLGVDESGEFHILAGGILNSNGGNKVGNNGSCTGTLTIDAGGIVNANGGWMMIAGNSNVTGIADISGELNIEGHLWMATGADSTATLDVYGVVNVGANIGLGTVNAKDPSGGTATINVNDGGVLNLDHWNNTLSIQDGSALNILGSGIVTVGGNRVDAAYGYAGIDKITGNGGSDILATYDSIADMTTIAVPEPMTFALLGLGGLLLRKRR